MSQSHLVSLDPKVKLALSEQVSQNLGVDARQAQKLVEQALPTMVEALAKNAEKNETKEALTDALKNQKHDGRILDPNQEFFADHNLDDGDKILTHVLGDTRDSIASALAKETKTSASQAQKTLAAISPVVMGSLGKVVQSKKLNATEVANLLKIAIQERNLGKLANRIAVLIWDKNSDGQYKDDLFEIGRRWISKFLSKKK